MESRRKQDEFIKEILDLMEKKGLTAREIEKIPDALSKSIEMPKHPEDEYDEPFTKIVICIGSMKKNELCSDFPIRVWVNGKKLERLRGFKFSANMDEPPILMIERSLC